MNPLDGITKFRARFPQARTLWELDNPLVGHLRAFSLAGRVVIIHEYPHGNG